MYSLSVRVASRLESVTAGNDLVEYGYLANSPLVETVKFKRSGANVVTTTRGYDLVGRLTSTSSQSGLGLVSSHAYRYNHLDQRTRAEEVGGDYWSYQHNSKGEVENGTKNDAGDNPLAGMNIGYYFDNIGNRTATTVDGVVNAAYTSNTLNQYTAITTTSSVSQVYDDDGNLTDDGTLLLAWDGENRLKTVHRKSDNALIATYTYDDQSRRVRKQTTAAAPQGARDRVYAWDGWNQVAELSHNSGIFTAIRYYSWGLDINGMEQGAGGVGGLVMQKEAASADVYYPTYDGNGNVAAMVKASDASIAAAYEYDPFGKTTASSGAYASTNPYRFSTKPLDEETEWYYYGHRYYQAETGRWLNRDPIEEDGGSNLYGMVGNDPVNQWDHTGLITGNDLLFQALRFQGAWSWEIPIWGPLKLVMGVEVETKVLSCTENGLNQSYFEAQVVLTGGVEAGWGWDVFDELPTDSKKKKKKKKKTPRPGTGKAANPPEPKPKTFNFKETLKRVFTTKPQYQGFDLSGGRTLYNADSACECDKEGYEWKAEIKGQVSLGIGMSGVAQADYDLLDRKNLFDAESYNIQINFDWTGYIGAEAGIYVSGGGNIRNRLQ